MIAGWCRRWRWVSGGAGKEEGVVRLLGGWQMLESIRALKDVPFESESEDEYEHDSYASEEEYDYVSEEDEEVNYASEEEGSDEITED